MVFDEGREVPADVDVVLAAHVLVSVPNSHTRSEGASAPRDDVSELPVGEHGRSTAPHTPRRPRPRRRRCRRCGAPFVSAEPPKSTFGRGYHVENDGTWIALSRAPAAPLDGEATPRAEERPSTPSWRCTGGGTTARGQNWQNTTGRIGIVSGILSVWWRVGCARRSFFAMPKVLGFQGASLRGNRSGDADEPPPQLAKSQKRL